MKIAFISYWSCPRVRLGVLTAGGMNVYVANLANNLGMLGHQVDIYTHKHKESEQQVLTTNRNVRIIHLPGNLDNPYEDVPIFADRVLKFISLNNLGYDIIHSHYYFSGLIGLILKIKLKIPMVQTFHTLGVTKELYSDQKQKERIKSEREIAEKADGIISSTELELEDLVKKYNADKRKISVLPPGVNHHVFRPYGRTSSRERLQLPTALKIILFVGRIDPVKGISLLIEAIDGLVKKYNSFENKYRVLLIGGDIKDNGFWKHPEVKRLKELIERKNLSCCIKFIGSRPHNILPYYYSAADVVVMPSVYESFGLVVLEAMASGSSVIVSKAGGLQYLVKDGLNGRLFENGSSRDLGDKLWQLLNNPKERKMLSENAVISSQNYCWDKQAEKIASLYKHYL